MAGEKTNEPPPNSGGHFEGVATVSYCASAVENEAVFFFYLKGKNAKNK